MGQISEMLARSVWSILRDTCGAKRDMAEDFARSWPKCGEYRFIGALGFGGKVYADQRGREWRVGYYPENRTPERDEMVKRANAALSDLEAEFVESVRKDHTK